MYTMPGSPEAILECCRGDQISQFDVSVRVLGYITKALETVFSFCTVCSIC